MTTKTVTDLDLKDAGVKARLEKLSGSLGGLFFDHEQEEIKDDDGQTIAVVHRLAVEMSECQMDEEGVIAAPGIGKGTTLDVAAMQVEGYVRDWLAEKRYGRKVKVGGAFKQVWMEGGEIRTEAANFVAPPRLEKDPYGGFRKEMLEYVPTGGIGALLDGMGR
jgi:hypothetical protein